MKNKLPCKALLFFLFYFILSYSSVFAQATQQNLNTTIRYYDSLFWQTFNSCDLKNIEKYFTDDLEFYHDKSGYDKGKAKTIENIRKNLCSNSNFRLRREEVPGSTEVFPLTKNDTIYGAIFSGEHVFYITENNNPPRLSGKAKFTHVWLVKDNSWKMARILSFDHQPAAQPSQKVAIKVSAATLDLYVGKYNAPKNGKVTIQRETDHLLLLVGDQRFEIFPETENKFFAKDRDLVFEFTKGSDGKISKMIVWENGKVAEEAIRDN